MAQVWLDANRRIWRVVLAAASILAAAGATAWADPWNVGAWLRATGVGLICIAAALLILWWLLGRQPRVAYDGQRVLFYVRLGAPATIPIDAVECFLLGHGPALLPGERHAKTETSTVVVRLAERAEEWTHGEAHPLLAAWCDGYITLRGTWCEPLDVSVVDRLNRLLHEASRAAA